MYKSEDLDRVKKEHYLKLQRYRERKDWEQWTEEDELDLEGERLLAEVKNYN
jgi:hypothetical protein